MSADKKFEEALKSFKGENKNTTSLNQSILLDISKENVNKLHGLNELKSGSGKFTKYINLVKKGLEISEVSEIGSNDFQRVNDEVNKDLSILKLEYKNIQRQIDINNLKLSQLNEDAEEINEIKDTDLEVSLIFFKMNWVP